MTDAIQKKISFGYAQIGSVKLHYAKAGSGGKLILLLHGFPEFWYSWRHQLVDLSDEYTVIAPDMRGYNLSDKPEKISDYEIEHLVDDVTGLIDHFGYKEAHLVGHDWGAGVAWAVAAKEPDYIEKVACLQVPPSAVWKKNQTIKQFFTSWYMFFFQLPKLPEWLLSRNNFEKLVISLKTTTAKRKVFTNEDIKEYKKAWNKEGSITAALNYYRANVLKRMFSKQTNGKILVPTLFIYGEKDHAILPVTVQNVGDFVDADYEEVRIPESAHWVQAEASQTVTDSLRDFFNK